MPRQTRLDDDAQIYNPQEQQTEKEKLKDMNFKQKLEYLWEYYRIHALAVVAIIALVIYIINSILNPGVSTKFYAALINSPIHPEVIDEFEKDFTGYLELDTNSENVVLNDTFNFNVDVTYTANVKQTLQAYVAAAEVDVIIAPEKEFAEYASYGAVIKLSDQLPTDLYSSLTDHFFISATEDDPEKNAYGIYITDTKLFAENSVTKDPYIIGIVGNSKHKDNAIEFIRFLLEEAK